ncbi:protein kinase [Nakamurella sp. YIM 132087]|uniref:non-specific serine/threonine protein kinase n=1 Tax=Nakamurella alba TaxID=2665158 RepID=A0A7K1FL02_9ACTN|nr:serine/threonine-protein kinase [Nakamurella alba]MTD14740.1 protein kinase [Nakamurella alba]
MSLTPGLLLSDRYRLTSRIAVGGMGEVWVAEDTRLARNVAVKILKSELTSDPEFVDRFRSEARITASLNHSGIAAVHDYGEVASIAGGPRDTAFLVMELVTGEPLSAVLARTPRLSVPRTLDVLEQSGKALQVAHAQALVHRDIKPGNILITPSGQVKITDFGIAKVAYQVPVTRGGMVMGTAQYLSPEQASGLEAVPASDVYALGIVAYECLAGHRPFNGEHPLSVAMMQVREEPPPLPPDIPPPVVALVMRMLAKDPAARFPDGATVSRAVAAVRAGGNPSVGFGPPASGGVPAPIPSAPVPQVPPRAVPTPIGPANYPMTGAVPQVGGRRTGLAVLITLIILAVVAVAGILVITVGSNSSGAPPAAIPLGLLQLFGGDGGST